jgi:transporter family-2 protein
MAARQMTAGSFLTIFFLSGCASALQARSNGELTHHIGNGLVAANWSFLSGLAILTAMVLVLPAARSGVARIWRGARTGSLAWWALPTGAIGGVFVTLQGFSVAMVGVATFTVGMVAGQTANSLVVDRIGLSPIGRTPISPRRVCAAAIAVVAVIVAGLGHLGGDTLPVAAILAAFLGGVIVAVQQALQGRVNIASGNPVGTAWNTFLFGAAMAAILMVIGLIGFGTHVHAPSSGPWWMWLGGAFGVSFIVTASWSVPRYGVLLFALVTISGQLAAALLLDVVAPVAGVRLEWQLIAGVGLTLVAVALASWRRSTARAS